MIEIRKEGLTLAKCGCESASDITLFLELGGKLGQKTQRAPGEFYSWLVVNSSADAGSKSLWSMNPIEFNKTFQVLPSKLDAAEIKSSPPSSSGELTGLIETDLSSVAKDGQSIGLKVLINGNESFVAGGDSCIVLTLALSCYPPSENKTESFWIDVAGTIQTARLGSEVWHWACHKMTKFEQLSFELVATEDFSPPIAKA